MFLWVKRKFWVRNLVNYIQANFNEYKIRVDKRELVIFNPYIKDRNIKVSFYCTHATLYFTYDAMQFEYYFGMPDLIIDFIEDIVGGEYAALKLIKQDKKGICSLIEISKSSYSTIEAIVSLLCPFLTEDELKQWCNDFGKDNPDYDHIDDTIKSLAQSFIESKEQYLDYLRQDTSIVCAESWNGHSDVCKQISWDGNVFSIIDISAEDLLKEG